MRLKEVWLGVLFVALCTSSIPGAFAFSQNNNYSSATYYDQSNARDAIDQACYTSDAFWKEVEVAVPKGFQSADLERFRGFCQHLRNEKPGQEIVRPNGQQLLAQYVFPGLDDKDKRTAYPATHFKELQKLQRNLEKHVQPVARRELDQLMQNRPLVDDDNHFEGMANNDGDNWQRAAWYGWQYLSLRGAKRFMPGTVQALQRAMGQTGPAHRFVGVTRQKAACKGVEHSDGRNYMLSTLTPLQCPEGCGIVVNGEESSIQEKPVILDNTFLHHVYNDHASIDRFCLMSECWHPDLTAEERDAIATLFAVKDRFTVLELELAPWGYDDESLGYAIKSGAVNDLNFWKDIGYSYQPDFTSSLESKLKKRNKQKKKVASAKGFGSKSR